MTAAEVWAARLEASRLAAARETRRRLIVEDNMAAIERELAEPWLLAPREEPDGFVQVVDGVIVPLEVGPEPPLLGGRDALAVLGWAPEPPLGRRFDGRWVGDAP